MSSTAFIAVNEPLLDCNERRYLNECIVIGWISSERPFVDRFEEGMAQRVGRGHGTGCRGSGLGAWGRGDPANVYDHLLHASFLPDRTTFVTPPEFKQQVGFVA